MPTVLQRGPYRFFFYAGDKEEPAHIHVERDDGLAKSWLAPVRFENSRGFGRKEIRRIQAFVEQYEQQLLERWNEFFHA